MKLLHIADLHLGKTLNKQSFLFEQYEALKEVVTTIERDDIAGVIVAGDIYDTKNPKREAIALYSWFVQEVTKRVPLFSIAGNHDLGELHQFATDLLDQVNYHTAGKFSFPLPCYELQHDDENVMIHLFPYVTLEDLNDYFSEDTLKFETLQEGIEWVMQHTTWTSGRHLLVFHGFVTGRHDLLRTDSERETTVGTAQAIDYHLFDAFDYVALGHLHRKQRVEKSHAYYSGSLYWYSESEANHDKGMLEIDLKQDGDSDVQFLPFHPIKRVKKIEGTLAELLQMDEEDDYVIIQLTEAVQDKNVKEILHPHFPNLLRIQQPEQYRLFLEEEDHFDFNTTMEEQIKQYYKQMYDEEMDDDIEMRLNQVFKEMETLQ